MKVLTVMVDVTDLTDKEIDDLQFAMEVQAEDAGGTGDDEELFDAPILNSGIKVIDENGNVNGNHS